MDLPSSDEGWRSIEDRTPGAAAAWWARLGELQGVWTIEATPNDVSSCSPSDMAHALARTRVAAVRALESTCRRSMSAQRRQMQQTVCMLEVRRQRRLSGGSQPALCVAWMRGRRALPLKNSCGVLPGGGVCAAVRSGG
jgi:hypothetical protein